MLTSLPLLVLLVTAPVPDPRQELVALEVAGRTREALARVQQEEAERPAAARQIGLGYLRGRLLELLGRPAESVPAFVEAISGTPKLAFYSRDRLAAEQVRLGHPEVAAGLLANGLAAEPTSPLAPEAVRLLVQSIGRGGDCRLLRGFRTRQLGAAERRQIQLAQADCDLRAGAPAQARTLLVALLDDNHEDEVARIAADRLAGLVGESERGRVPLLLSTTFFEHREFDRSVRQLAPLFAPAATAPADPRIPGGRVGPGTAAGGRSRKPPARELAEARYALGRVDFWQGRFETAATTFAAAAEVAPNAAERARALLQQGRSYEMLRDWQRATASFRLAFVAEPGGEWAAPALLGTLRLEWRRGNEDAGTAILALLGSRAKWRDSARRAALFLASSDLVRGRADRAGAWLERAATGAPDEERPETAYWRGRLAELQQRAPAAIAAYLEALRADPYHPLARAALRRLNAGPLAAEARAAGRRLAASHSVQDLEDAWLLLGPGDAGGRLAEQRLRAQLLANPAVAPYLRMSEVPTGSWPLWSAPARRPEDLLLALGLWHEGGPAVREHFPPAQPDLALTGSMLLARNGEPARSIQLAEALRERLPARLPLELLPPAFQRCLYPFAYREPLLAEGRLRGVDPYLLAALIRTGSRFDPQAQSPGAALGLTQFVLATARGVAASIGMDHLEAEDLYRPEVAIDLGGAYLARLTRAFRGTPHIAVAAYDAGEAQAILWRSWCFSPEPEEYFTKIGFRETRLAVAHALAAWAHYKQLYG
jgi:soluble lytic murein transglycosylase